MNAELEVLRAVAGTPVKRSEDVSKDVSKDGDKKK